MGTNQTEQFLADVKRLKYRFPVKEIAAKTGFPKSNVSEYINGRKEPSSNFLKKFYTVYPNFADSTEEEASSTVADTGVPYNQKEFSDKEISMQAILSLVRSNEKFAQAALITAEKDKIQAQSQANITQSNLELTKLIRRFADSAIETAPVSQATIGDLLVLIAEVGSGKTWHSRDEALAALNKRFFDTQNLKKEGGILRG